jgi:hypothetical protein
MRHCPRYVSDLTIDWEFYPDMFTICLCTSPDLDGYQGTREHEGTRDKKAGPSHFKGAHHRANCAVVGGPDHTRHLPGWRA